MSSFLSVEAIASLSPHAQALVAAMDTHGAATAVHETKGVNGGTFGQMVSDGLSQVNQQLIGDQSELQRLAIGDAQNLHQVMIKLEESRLSFQLMMQVRNRALEAYQELMRMSI